MEKTFRAIFALSGAAFFMFLQKYYYTPRDELQRLVRACLDSRCPAGTVGSGWPGGARAFRREFKLYHGLSVVAWAHGDRRKPKQPVGSPLSAGGG